MAFEQARAIVLSLGHENNFYGWSLHQALFGGPNPIYTFTWGDKIVVVDAVTGEVTETPIEPQSTPLTAAPGDDSVSIEMILAAGEKIKEFNANAFIIWAGGRDGDNQPLNQAGDTNVWDFYAVDNGIQLQAYQLKYDGDWLVAELAVPPFGIQFLDISQVTMDVVEAWDIAVDAGYPGPYNWWTVFKPLNPTVQNPGFVFRDSSGRYIIVDTVTGEVSVE
jgi:hypothetical protein